MQPTVERMWYLVTGPGRRDMGYHLAHSEAHAIELATRWIGVDLYRYDTAAELRDDAIACGDDEDTILFYDRVLAGDSRARAEWRMMSDADAEYTATSIG